MLSQLSGMAFLWGLFTMICSGSPYKLAWNERLTLILLFWSNKSDSVSSNAPLTLFSPSGRGPNYRLHV